MSISTDPSNQMYSVVIDPDGRELYVMKNVSRDNAERAAKTLKTLIVDRVQIRPVLLPTSRHDNCASQQPGALQEL